MQRLKTRAQFQAVLAGSTVARTAHFALHRCALDGPSLSADSSAAPLFTVDDVWIGAMVPKRWAKRAVTRNAIKRQVYNVSAQSGAVLPRAAHVVRLRAAFDRKEFISASSEKLKAAVRAELQQLLARAAATPSAGAASTSRKARP
ncbi:ribonuclease P protein component [Variovorax robiniae]|uniref:Ribonuclease P protein component n=1 Tax=Variovorax robiniae TaxID=1836199 RepID=A0ABU8XBG5_9BURK